MKTIFKIIAVLVLFTGCSSIPETTPPQSFTSESSTGLAVGTITFEGDKPINDIYRFFYEATSGDKKFKKANAGKIVIKAREGNDKGFTGDMNNRKTYLFIIERQPGTYAFTQYNYLDRIGPTGMVSSSGKFAIPFEIKKGTITYIGEFTYNDTAAPGTPRIVVDTSFERDIQALKQKHTAINWDKVENTPIKSGDSGNGIVEFHN